MRIFADENIPLLSSFFADLGEVNTFNGRNVTASEIRDAEVLLVRSVTQVDRSLLEGSKVRFVGTATIGTDHIDLDYLKQSDIGFCSAPGCNAQAVVDYVLSVISVLVDARDLPMNGLSVGIVGVGNVGHKLRLRLEEMGVSVVATDPFKTEEQVGPLTTLDEVLKSDIVTLHTPMTRDGEHPTWHMIGAEQLQAMKDDACLINSCRGSVVDNDALLEHAAANRDFDCVLDVWEHEPELDLNLMDCCLLATPHIAGYSLDGKMRGTEMVYQGVCEHFGFPVRRKLPQFLPEPGIKRVNFSDQEQEHQALRTAIRAAYEVRVDDGKMRTAMRKADDLRSAFDKLRRNYPMRRDIPTLKIGVPSKCLELQQALRNAGFDVRTK
ncbi:MAG: 4-phosphoerythronate dehydrogenase PdxB [Oceanospirillaceae bacterium]|nr:4-phosphoerythronate dehydrogenase PdxB [Oceanospirillaceae bacterium]